MTTEAERSPTGARSFTVEGMRNGSPVRVTWAEGALSGDFPTIDLLSVQAEMAQNAADDPAFASQFAELRDLGPDPLSDPATAYRLIVSVLDSVGEVSGGLAGEVAAALDVGRRAGRADC